MIEHHGFYFPPHGLIELLESVMFTRDVHIYLHDPLTGAGELPYEQIAVSDKSNLFIIIQTGEGHSHKEFDLLLHKLTVDCNVPTTHIVIYSGCLYDPDSPVYNIGTIATHTGITLDATQPNPAYINDAPTHHYVCLNRMPRWERYQIVKGLLDRNLESYGKITYGSGVEDWERESRLLETFVTPEYAHLFPMTIDADVVDIDGGFDVSHAITGALFNVVTESSFDYQPDIPNYLPGQTLPTLSEKTYKCFIMGQIPLLVAPPHTVQVIREFGFDVFDDLVNHSYDLETNPAARIHQVANEIEKWCNKPLTELVQLKQELKPRFINNLEKLKYRAYNYNADKLKWLEYFRTQGVVS